MTGESVDGLVSLDLREPVWERAFIVAPLVIVGTVEPDGSADLAPKHMVTPLSWQNYFGFVCTPSHATYRNAVREGAFTASFPRPDQVVLMSLAAAPRCDDHSKPALTALPTLPARSVEGVLVRGAYLHFECELDRIVDDFGTNSLVAGRIVAAYVAEDSIRESDRDDGDLLSSSPLFAYLHPGRFARVGDSFSFPFHSGTKR